MEKLKNPPLIDVKDATDSVSNLLVARPGQEVSPKKFVFLEAYVTCPFF